jgi:hypothetical protein
MQMADKTPPTDSQTQQNPQVQQAQQAAAKMMEDQLDRMQAFQAEIAKLEAKGVEQARQAIDEAARLWKESLSYGAQLGAAWRNLAIDATRRSVDAMTPTRS